MGRARAATLSRLSLSNAYSILSTASSPIVSEPVVAIVTITSTSDRSEKATLATLVVSLKSTFVTLPNVAKYVWMSDAVTSGGNP